MEIAQNIIVTLTYVVLGKCQMEPFIVGGEDAKISNFPYVAHLGVECVEDKGLLPLSTESWICGSSILNQDLILTAAHCVFGCKEKTLIVVSVGHEKQLQGAVTTAHSFIIHEHYSNMWLANDIAMVKVNTPIRFNQNVSRVALVEYPPYKEEAELAGWGLVDENERTPTDVLKYIKQYVWEKKDCLELLKRMSEGTFCASAKNESNYAALGDSGSPLVVRGYIQLGIVSSKTYKFSRSVAVYTDIGFYYDWIMEHANIITCPAECSDCIIL